MATTFVDVIEDLKSIASTLGYTGVYNKLEDARMQLLYASAPDINVAVSAPPVQTTFDVVEV